MNPSAVSILAEARRTRKHLRELCLEVSRGVEAQAIPDGVHADERYLSDCLDRFNIWAGSLGVFQKGDASLDSRLANHMLAHEVVRLLRQCHEFTSSLKAIIKGSRIQETWTKESLKISSDEFSDLDDSSDEESIAVLTPETGDEGPSDLDEIITESKDLHLSVDESITSLLKLSIQVHSSSKKAKFAKSSIDAEYSILPDTKHVAELFPFASNNDALIERLGKANAQRRQWIGYRRRHREKLSVDTSETGETRIPVFTSGSQGDSASIAIFSATDQEAESVLSGTKATTYESGPATSLGSQSLAPKTVYEPSTRASISDARLKKPKPPANMIFGKPYLCDYCCNVIEMGDRSEWENHVHSDLSSYTCVYDNCDEMHFESRHKWWAHEMETHRKEWKCSMCRSTCSSFTAMKGHMDERHADLVLIEQIEDVIDKFSRPLGHINAADCPLCDYAALLRSRGYTEEQLKKVPTQTFGRHLGRHLEQLSLFVIPNSDLEEEGYGLINETLSNNGSTHSESDSSPPESQILSQDNVLHKLSEIETGPQRSPEIFLEPPDLAMRWQPPQDFTPPIEDFDTEDIDLLPERQEPIYGGDLFTPGWARKTGAYKEGFCARCPVFHWVNIPNGSYRFHLTYFHGVPDSGVPLPRPSIIQPSQARPNTWKAFCDACNTWRTLRKTRRGWNWYRHWLDDHAELVKERTDAVRDGDAPEKSLSKSVKGSTTEPQELLDGLAALEERFLTQPNHTEIGGLLRTQFAKIAKKDMAEALESSLKRLAQASTRERLRTIMNQDAQDGETLLMISASQGFEKLVKMLLKLGVDPNTVSPSHKTALDLSADAGYFNIAKLIVDSGGDISISPVLNRIISNDQEYSGEMRETVIRPSLSSTIDPETLTPLGQAAYSGDLQKARGLLGDDETGHSQCDIEGEAELGRSPLLLASIQGHLDIVNLLLSCGANINTTSKHGWTPLMLTTKREDIKTVSHLLSKGADVNHLSPDHWTALAEAASGGNTDIMALLLNAGADADVRAQSDWTPLMHAAYRGDIVAVDLLLRNGASFEEISARDETVMLLAAAKGSTAVVRRLLDAGCAPESRWSKELFDESDVEETDALSSLSSKESSTKQQQRIERTFKVGWTPLMLATQAGSLEVVTMLLDAGANQKPKSPMFKTAVEIAQENGRADIADYLTKRQSQDNRNE